MRNQKNELEVRNWFVLISNIEKHVYQSEMMRAYESEERCNLDLAAHMDYLETLQFADGRRDGCNWDPLVGYLA